MFRKIGDIKTKLKSDDTILYQTMEYLYFTSHIFSPYTRLAITRYADDRVSFILESSTPEQYTILKQAYRSGGFPKPDYLDNCLKFIALSHNNKNIIVNFLKVLKNIEPSFSEVENEIYAFLSLDPLYEHEMPVWIKDNFDKDRIIYRSAEKTELDIARFEIISHKLNMFSFGVIAANQLSYEDLEYMFITLGFPEPLPSEKKSLMLLFNFDMYTFFDVERLLEALRPFCSYKLILDDIHQSIEELLPNEGNYKKITMTSEQCNFTLKNFSIFETANRSTTISKSEPESNPRNII